MDLCLSAVIGHSTPPVWSRMCSYGLGPFCCYGSGSTPYHFKAPVGKEFLEEKRRSKEELEVGQDYESSNRIIKSTRKREHDLRVSVKFLCRSFTPSCPPERHFPFGTLGRGWSRFLSPWSKLFSNASLCSSYVGHIKIRQSNNN